MREIHILSLAITSLLFCSLTACHHEENVAQQPQPSEHSKNQPVLEHPPVVKDSLESLPELMLGIPVSDKPVTIAQPVAQPEEQLVADKTISKQKQLTNIIDKNAEMKARITALEKVLLEKESVSQQISKKINAAQAKLNR